jgi:hypothetical protein
MSLSPALSNYLVKFANVKTAYLCHIAQGGQGKHCSDSNVAVAGIFALKLRQCKYGFSFKFYDVKKKFEQKMISYNEVSRVEIRKTF